MANRKWSEEECAVLVYLFTQSSFAIGDDGREENKLIARDFARKSGSIDRQWRNIKDYLNRETGKKIGSTLKYYCDVATDDIGTLKKYAVYICKKNKWYEIEELLKNGTRE
jgi:hypothetical protein